MFMSKQSQGHEVNVDSKANVNLKLKVKIKSHMSNQGQGHGGVHCHDCGQDFEVKVSIMVNPLINTKVRSSG